MWQELFHRSQVVTRFAEGPWHLYLDEFVAFLQQQHYEVRTIRRVLCASDHFARWLASQNLTLSDADPASVTRYRETLGRCAKGALPHRGRGLHLALEFLLQKGIASIQTSSDQDTPTEIWLDRFGDYLEGVVGAAPSTREGYRTIVARFLQNRFSDAEPNWSALSAADLSAFIQHEAGRRRGFGRQVPSVALRSFLRFLVANGLVRDGLSAAIPSSRSKNASPSANRPMLPGMPAWLIWASYHNKTVVQQNCCADKPSDYQAGV